MRPGPRFAAPLTLLALTVVLPPGLPGARAASAPAAPTQAAAAAVACGAPQPGRYVVIGDGEVQGEPMARILQETWKANGLIEGVRLERRGHTYREQAYIGRFRPISLCRVAIERSYGNALSTSQAVLDQQGRPRYSLGTLPDVVVVSRWFPQAGSSCSVGLLDGTVLNQQQGRSWRNNRWQANAVIQHERWRGGQVQGIAISSYSASIEEATYSGSLTMEANCLATVKERDSLGVDYNYRAVVLADGSGYVYLQTDPNDLTVGYLEHEPTAPSPLPASGQPTGRP